ncbi:hypothetical protein KGG70_gp39 [Streptomyces phage Celia]|uniref:Uncharacterized protein n=1 Tax=Streptomyces phage Celia TaxID=2590946 RepID=A0A516KRH4_9CAUD|nr:hypothetical protein KGG70_gp39 [Streptomyces phage Celia]QDP44245.1 hypothetical protein SEA_CELIA_42 [Streptomyces phage Celia]QFG10505.1 hypothetical protein SEA_URZA_42 [Streptomyces phage Urza]QJD50607.1 hypothetical protein SEA_ITZA_42 [Streptomyces phage Itza]
MSDETTTETKPTTKRAPRKTATATKTVTPTERVLAEVADERTKQDERWGEQNHPLIGGLTPKPRLVAEYAREENHWQEINKHRVRLGAMGWDSIAAEELFEAVSARDLAEARAEYVQLAAVAVAAVEAIDRGITQ